MRLAQAVGARENVDMLSAAEVSESYRSVLLIAAALAVAAGLVMSVGLAPHLRLPRSVRRLHCAVDGPPLQPDPDRCPAPGGNMTEVGVR